MSKRSRHPSGFYASLLSDDLGHAYSSKYRPRVRPAVMGIYEVERIVAKRFVGGRAKYFIQWKNYCPSENTWEPAEHLPEELIWNDHNQLVGYMSVHIQRALVE